MTFSANLPTFDTDTYFSDVPTAIARVPWISENYVSPAHISPLILEGKETGKAVIVFNSQHNLLAGQKIYLHNVALGIDGWVKVQEHPDERVDRSICVVIDRAVEMRYTVGIQVHFPEVFNVMPPTHLPGDSSLELENLDFKRLEGMQILDPQRLLATLVSLRQRTVYGETWNKDEIAAQLRAEGESEAADALEKQNIEVPNFFEGREQEFEQDLLQLTRKYDAEMRDAEQLNSQEMARLNTIQYYVRCRECELLLGMKEGHLSKMRGFVGMKGAIDTLHAWILDRLKENAHPDGSYPLKSEEAPEGKAQGVASRSKPSASKKRSKTSSKQS